MSQQLFDSPPPMQYTPTDGMEAFDMGDASASPTICLKSVGIGLLLSVRKEHDMVQEEKLRAFQTS